MSKNENSKIVEILKRKGMPFKIDIWKVQILKLKELDKGSMSECLKLNTK